MQSRRDGVKKQRQIYQRFLPNERAQMSDTVISEDEVTA
jgi:hypothetical protein